MRKIGLGLRVSLLLLAAALLACSQSPTGSSQGGSGGSASGGSTGSGGVATGGAATGGGVGSGGSAGGASGASGGSSGRGGVTGVGGSEPGGAGGSEPGGAGGSEPGGAGGAGSGGTQPGGSGGTSPGGAGGRSTSDGSAGGAGGNTDGGGPDSGGGATADATPASSCTDKKANGDETDVDCGGGTCPKCGAGKICKQDGDCKSGSCASGKCADPFAATGTITSSTDKRIWTITLGTMVLEVQTGGGKIVTYSLDGTNFLVVNDASTGSVFWIAPQAEWNANGWPPPSEMDDNTAYTASSQGNVLTMASPVGTTDGLSISKRFWGNLDHQTVTMEYTIKNGGSAEVKKAPWEVTRVYPGGLTFFPTAEPPVQMPGTCNCFLAVPFTTNAGVAWFKYQKADFTQDIKGGADGLEGWAAHVNCGTGLEKTCATGSKSMVLIKEWDDSTVMAPDEKEIEIYANAGHNYVEFEQQGDYQTIPAGATVVWTMHWMLRYLPANLTPAPGSAEIVTWVRGQLL